MAGARWWLSATECSQILEGQIHRKLTRSPIEMQADRGEVITLEMGPGSQKAKNTIGPDLKSFLGNAFVCSEFQYRSSIPRAFLDHHTKQSKMIQLAECAED